MHLLAIRRPGERGTQKLVARYGDRLVCVRYRYDACTRKRYKAVELIIEDVEWAPPATASQCAPEPKLRVDYLDELPEDQRTTEAEVGVKVFFREHALREQVRAAGGRWSTTDKLWMMPHETTVSFGLGHRIVKR